MFRSPTLRLLAALILITLLTPPPGMARGPSDTGLHQAGLVVQFSNGNYITRCVGFPGDEISGAELLRRSGLRVIMGTSEDNGAAICKIEEDGCDYPDEPCFCQCLGGGQCLYWAYYLWSVDGWRGSGIGASARELGDGDVDGWVWGRPGPPPTISWDEVRDPTRTSAGYPRVAAQGDSLHITAPFQGDEDGDGTAKLRYRPVGGSWVDSTEMARQTEGYVAQLSGLPDGHYETEVTYQDPDGVNGSAVWTQESLVGRPTEYRLYIPLHFMPLYIEPTGITHLGSEG